MFVLPLSLHFLGLSRKGNANLQCTVSLANPSLLIRISFPLHFSSLVAKAQNQSSIQRQLCHVALQGCSERSATRDVPQL